MTKNKLVQIGENNVTKENDCLQEGTFTLHRQGGASDTVNYLISSAQPSIQQPAGARSIFQEERRCNSVTSQSLL
jgi:hypothetical protein